MPQVLIMYNLKADADSREYERWSLAVDQPAVRTLPSVVDLTSFRVVGKTSGAPSYQFVEIIQVTSLEAFQADLEAPYLRHVMDRWLDYVAEYEIVYLEEIQP